jgi:hypothetical protein
MYVIVRTACAERALLLGGSAGDAWAALARCASILAFSIAASGFLLRRRTA